MSTISKKTQNDIILLVNNIHSLITAMQDRNEYDTITCMLLENLLCNAKNIYKESKLDEIKTTRER